MHSNNLTKQNLCSSIPPTVFAFQRPHEMRGQKRCSKTSRNGPKKDDHPDLNGLFLVTPALSDGAIFTIVTLNAMFLSSP
jgi:hypothetical protein